MFPIVTPFPFLLDFAFFAPLILRLALGFYILSYSNKRQDILHKILFALLGLSLVIGIYTQIGAIIASVFILYALSKKEISLTELLLLLAISISLLLTGAGPLAFDLPL